MRIVYIMADSASEFNCSYHNAVVPAAATNRIEGHHADVFYIGDFVTNKDEVRIACEQADIIVLERNFFGDTLTMVQYWKVRGKTIIAIFDDAYDLIHPKNVSYNFWTHGEVKYMEKVKKTIKETIEKDGNKEEIEKEVEVDEEKVAYMSPKPLEQFKWGMQIVKAIQVPSAHLQKDWSKYNETKYIHNYLEIDKYLGDIKPLHPHDNIVIGWCGSMSHVASFTDSGVAIALKKICKKYPQVSILMGGDKRNFDMLEVDRKMFQPYVPAEQWTSLLKTLDIGLAPLAGEYDKRRSWIKVLEYLALKIPWVASNYPTYDELKPYGLMTENGSKNWEYALSEMIDNYATYQEKANTIGYEFALTQSSDNNIRNTIAWYEEIIKKPYPTFDPKPLTIE